MEPEELYLLLSDADTKEQILDIFYWAFGAFFETEEYFQIEDPKTKEKEWNCEHINLAAILLRISNNLERIANSLESK